MSLNHESLFKKKSLFSHWIPDLDGATTVAYTSSIFGDCFFWKWEDPCFAYITDVIKQEYEFRGFIDDSKCSEC